MESKLQENLHEMQAESTARKLYLWGAGNILNHSIDFLKCNFRIEGIIDKGVHADGGRLFDIPLYAPDILDEMDRDRTMFCITCIHVREIADWLRKSGFHYVYDVFHVHRDPMYKFHPPLDSEGLSQVHILNEMLEDCQSKEVLRKLIDKRAIQSLDYSDIHEKNQYFPDDVWQIGKDESFIDAGAFDGDTVAAIGEMTRNEFRAVYAFEPDTKNFSVLEEKYREDMRVHCYPYATWDSEAALCFSDGEAASSTIAESGKRIRAVALDDVIESPVTFIKMDVEGAEMRSLRGARNLICRYKPKLAICVYHKADDLWKIPFLIRDLVPEYRFMLRHHSDLWFETVIYAQIDKVKR